ncbi:MAG: type II toxin-antitoxin system RelE/ParE family toxin [Candidatus Eisenbacteria bacterium]
MDVRFRQSKLDRLETEPGDGGLPPEVVKAYRKRIQLIRAADDERVFRGLRALHYEKLKGKRKHQRSMRLNDQWRLILEFEGEGEGADRVVWVVDIVDYH